MKTWLIHKLGGYTFSEYHNYGNKCKAEVVNELRDYATEIYGIPADEWCAKMFGKLTNFFTK